MIGWVSACLLSKLLTPIRGARKRTPYSRSWCETVDPAIEESNLPHVAEPCDAHEQTSQADTKPTMRRAAVSEETEVVFQRSEGVAFLLSLLDQLLVAINALMKSRTFCTSMVYIPSRESYLASRRLAKSHFIKIV